VDPINLLWFFFMLSAIQPVIKQRMLEAARARLLERAEKERGSRVILLVHRQETMSLLGFPVFRYIDVNDSEEVTRAIDLTDDEVPIDVVLHTPGGLVLAALQIARAIASHKGKVTVFVPHYAMSGGTLIALAADEIVLSRHAVLGPVDPQIGKYPAASILRATQRKPPDKLDDETLVFADQAEMAIRQVREAVEELLAGQMPAEKVKELAQTLSEGRWTHDHPITPQHAQELGLNVSTDMPAVFLRLMSLFPQPVRRSPTVEYVPQRRRVGESAGSRTS
jgi:ClpP class serine protease